MVALVSLSNRDTSESLKTRIMEANDRNHDVVLANYHLAADLDTFRASRAWMAVENRMFSVIGKACFFRLRVQRLKDSTFQIFSELRSLIPTFGQDAYSQLRCEYSWIQNDWLRHAQRIVRWRNLHHGLRTDWYRTGRIYYPSCL